MQRTRTILAGAVVAVAVGVGGASGGFAQDVQIRDDGPNVSNSAAGASNTRIERAPGNQQAISNNGQNNREAKRASRGENRQNKDDSGGNGGGEPAPSDGFLNPDTSGLQEPAPVAEPVAAETAQPAPAPASGSATSPIQLPKTGTGGVDLSMISAIVAAAGASLAGWSARKRLADA